MKHKYFVSFVSQTGYGNIVIEFPKLIASAEDIINIQDDIQKQIEEKTNSTKFTEVRVLFFKELFDE